MEKSHEGRGLRGREKTEKGRERKGKLRGGKGRRVGQGMEIHAYLALPIPVILVQVPDR